LNAITSSQLQVTLLRCLQLHLQILDSRRSLWYHDLAFNHAQSFLTSWAELNILIQLHYFTMVDPILTSSKGLAIGAKVGIGVGVTLGVLLFLAPLIIASLYHRRRRRQRPPGNNNNTDPKSNTHEMITNSNRHELPTNHNVHEMEQENQDGLTTLQEITLKPHQERHELDPSSRVIGPEVQLNGYPSPSELEATPSPKHAGAALSPPGREHSVSPKPVAPKPEQGGDEEGTRRIPDIVERIRIKKERLWELLELQHLEEIANRHNSDNVRMTGDEGGRSGTG